MAICARRLKVSKKLYIHTTIRKNAAGEISAATMQMAQHIRISESPRFI